MHDAYEAAAERHGWSTQARSRKPWADVPEANKATMREAVAAVLPVVRQQIADEIESDLKQQEEMSMVNLGQYASGMLRAARVVRG